MNIDELISELESAAELATDDRVTSLDAMSRLSGEVITARIDRRVASAVSRDEAQAIAIRHNTAAMVLSELRRLSDDVAKLEAETDRVEASRECPDHPDSLQMIRCTSCGEERRMPA